MCLIGCFQSSEVRLLSNHNNINHIENSVVMLVAARDENMLDDQVYETLGLDHDVFCAGFFIDQNTIITANHCVVLERRYEPKIKYYKVITYQMYHNDFHMRNYKLFQVIKQDKDADIAILKLVSRQDDFYREHLCISYNEHFIGDQVITIGHPAGHKFILTEGIISQDDVMLNHGRVIQATTDIFHGNSGGPLINSSGCVIGVTSAFWANRSHLGIFSSLRNERTDLEQYSN